MDWSLVIFLVVVVFFTYRGYRKGLLRSLSRILSLLAGYITSILYAGRVSACWNWLTLFFRKALRRTMVAAKHPVAVFRNRPNRMPRKKEPFSIAGPIKMAAFTIRMSKINLDVNLEKIRTRSDCWAEFILPFKPGG